MRKLTSVLIKISLVTLILMSILITYYNKVILKNYTIIFTESGIPELEE